METVPVVGAMTPATVLIRVDFPHPFSPTRQWISPGLTSQSILFKARTPPKRLEMPVSCRKGAVVFMPGSQTQGDEPVNIGFVERLELLRLDQAFVRIDL